MVKFEKLIKSPIAGKKWRVYLSDGEHERHVDFGATGYEDYTQHHDKERRQRYRDRHQKDLETEDPTRAGFLSYYILWGDSTSFERNLSAFKRKFSL